MDNVEGGLDVRFGIGGVNDNVGVFIEVGRGDEVFGIFFGGDMLGEVGVGGGEGFGKV